MTRKSKRRTSADDRPQRAAPAARPHVALRARERAPALAAWIARGRHVLLDGPEGSGRRELARHAARTAERLFVEVRAQAVRQAHELLEAPAIVRGRDAPTTVSLRAVLRGELDLPATIWLEGLHHVPEAARIDLLARIDAGAPLADARGETGLAWPANASFAVPINNARPPLGSLPVVADAFASFVVVKVDWPEPEDEIDACAAAFPSLDPHDLERVVAVANALRMDPALDRDLPHAVVRDACELLALRADEDALRAVLRAVFAARYPGSIDDEDSEARAAWERIDSTLAS